MCIRLIVYLSTRVRVHGYIYCLAACLRPLHWDSNFFQSPCGYMCVFTIHAF